MDVAGAPSGTGILTRPAHGCLARAAVGALAAPVVDGIPTVASFADGGPGFRGPGFIDWHAAG